VVNIRVGSGGKLSDWAWWYAVGLFVVEKFGLGVVVNIRIRRGVKQSDWSWW
jgi:hypothetical protein